MIPSATFKMTSQVFLWSWMRQNLIIIKCIMKSEFAKKKTFCCCCCVKLEIKKSLIHHSGDQYASAYPEKKSMFSRRTVYRHYTLCTHCGGAAHYYYYYYVVVYAQCSCCTSMVYALYNIIFKWKMGKCRLSAVHDICAAQQQHRAVSMDDH